MGSNKRNYYLICTLANSSNVCYLCDSLEFSNKNKRIEIGLFPLIIFQIPLVEKNLSNLLTLILSTDI
jgi:hypothetical protein